MNNIKAWIGAARLRTLPLSVSGIIVGSSLGNSIFTASEGINFPFAGWTSASLLKSPIFWLAILTTIGFQVISNFANDYGDGVKGTDDNRKGEARAVASGSITPRQMKNGIIITSIITLCLATFLIYLAFGKDNFLLSAVFFFLGLASIAAAIKYTVGEDAYGYSGFGDVFVFLFFGIVSVLGSYFLFTKQIDWQLILPAITIGLFSVAVLNLNNMRDIDEDALHSKRTLAVKLGSKRVKKYHYSLLIFGMLSAIVYTILNFQEYHQFAYVLTFIPLLLNLKTVSFNTEPSQLDGELKKVALSTFAFAILFSILH